MHSTLSSVPASPIDRPNPAGGGCVPMPIRPVQEFYLDALRMAGAQAVLVAHACDILRPAPVMMPLGGLGVVMFFFISGFLICHTALRRRSNAYGFGDFILDRSSRIFTAYWPALVAVALVDAALLATGAASIQPYAASTGPLQMLGNALMLQDYPVFVVAGKLLNADPDWLVRPYGSAGPFWTVAIEFWIYIAFGILVFKVAAGRPFGGPVVALLALVAFGSATYNMVAGFGDCLTLLWLLGAAACIGGAQGTAVLARLAGPSPGPRLTLLAAAAVLTLGLLAIRVVSGHVDTVYDLQTAGGVGVLMFIGYLACGEADRLRPNRPPRGLAARAVRFLAAYSYSLYLTHHTLLVALAGWGDPAFWSGWAGLLTAMLLAQPVAVVFWWLFERRYKAVAHWVRALHRPRFQSAPSA